MGEKKKTIYVDLNVKTTGFVSKFVSSRRKDYDFSDIILFRKLLSNEKAKILHTLKKHKPKSIYSLAKMLKRDFKSVRTDLLLLERFGFVEFHSHKKGKRESLIPVLNIDKINVVINI